MKRWNYCVSLAITAVALAAPEANNHLFTVKDDIEMVRFSDPRPLPGVLGTEVAQRSPDGKHFAVVTTKGILESDQVESEVSIFDLKTAKAFLESSTSAKPPKPRTVARITTYPHHEEAYAYAPVIKDVRWSPDRVSIFFRGEDQNGAYRLYVAKIDGSGSHAVTPEGYSVDRYSVAGNTIVYTASQMTSTFPTTTGYSINGDAKDITGYRLQDILFPGQLNSIVAQTYTLWAKRLSHGKYITSQVPGSSIKDQTYLSFEFPFVVSPQGNKVIEVTPVAEVPRSWEDYEPASGFEHLRYRSTDPRLTESNNLYRPKEYTLIDLNSGKKRSLVNAPNTMTLVYGDKNLAAWSSDGRRVLLTNTFLSLNQVPPEEKSQRVRPCAAAIVDVNSLYAHCLLFNENGLGLRKATIHVQEVSFGADDNEANVVVDIGNGKRAIEQYRFATGSWSQISSVPVDNETTSEEIQLVVKQTLNDSPALWVSDKKLGGSRELWDPNPRFTSSSFGRVSVYDWKDKTGHEWTGGLVKPVDYVSGNRYPLVIQIYMFEDGQFMTDGTDPTAFAARELASAGFVVLQIQKDMIHSYDDAEAEEHFEAMRSAIEHLGDEGLIDPQKVGAVGFSWTCWYVENALIKEPGLFAAATVADGVNHSYMEYHLFDEGSRTLEQQDERIIGARPFGDGLKTWIARTPGFHLDKVRTPLRIEAINPASLLGEWEIYSSLRMQNKPVDLIYFQHGTHIHQRPLERLESQQGDVDWFRFWLQGYEDPDPTKKAQYEGWEHLKELQNAEDQVVGKPSNETTKPN